MSELLLERVDKILGTKQVIHGLDLHVKSGELVSLLGASGSGKTTMLRIIGGFLFPDAGVVQIGGKECSHVPPERRPTAMVFQNYALWPNMTVRENIAFGLKIRKLPRPELTKRLHDVLEMVNLSGYERAYPAQLSGGQQQRVALARALALEPDVLLLDEPLSNLDAKLRLRVREEIRDIQLGAGITTVFVTHDQDEALSISDRIAVLNEGRLEQFASPDELYSRPRTRFVAEFIGSMNILCGRAVSDGIEVDGTFIPCEQVSTLTQTDTDIAVRPEDVLLDLDGGNDGVPAQVTRKIARGHYSELSLRFVGGVLRAFVPNSFECHDVAYIRFRQALVYVDGVLKERAVG